VEKLRAVGNLKSVSNTVEAITNAHNQSLMHINKHKESMAYCKQNLWLYKIYTDCHKERIIIVYKLQHLSSAMQADFENSL
jgi:hypothetical protein